MENDQDEAASCAALKQVATEVIAQTQIANVTRDGAPVVDPPQTHRCRGAHACHATSGSGLTMADIVAATRAGRGE